VDHLILLALMREQVLDARIGGREQQSHFRELPVQNVSAPHLMYGSG